MMRNNYTLVVDEETQGYAKEFGSIEGIVTALTPLLDEQLIEIRVKRKGTANNNSSSKVGKL